MVSMTPISYSAWVRRCSSYPPGYRRSIPRQTSWWNQLASVSPSGSGNFGIRFDLVNSTSARSATSSVLSHPACQSSSVLSPRISCGLFT